MKDAERKIIIIDAENQILGRMASKTAKLLLMGYKVYIVNAEKAVLSGEPKRVIEGYLKMFSVQTYRNPETHGIRRERSPRNIVRAAVKGMLPASRPKGRKALKNLRVYIGYPENLKKRKSLKFTEADASKLRTKYISVSSLAARLGWRGGSK